jgi:hypothetical protein
MVLLMMMMIMMCGVESLRISTSQSSNTLFFEFDVFTQDTSVIPQRGFGLDRGGTISLKGTISKIRAPLNLVVLNPAHLEQMDSIVSLRERNSELFEPSWCLFGNLYRQQLFEGRNGTLEFSVNFTAEKKGRYYAVLLNCDQGVYVMDAMVELVNPGGEQLSLEQISLKLVYRGILVFDCVCLVLWSMYLIWMRNNLRIMHKLLTGACLVRILYVGLLFGYIEYLSKAGSQTPGFQ